MTDISDLRRTIVPKSDQLNAEQLLNSDMTIAVSEVRMGTSEEQPVILHYINDEGRPYKPCKTMRKLLIFAWGEDGRAWVGRSMTLFNDAEVRFGGMTVGGIRIRALSHIDKPIKVSLTATKGKKALHSIDVLQAATLGPVLEAIEAATNKADMDRAKAMAMELTVPAEIERAQKAYAARVQALKKKPEAAKPATYDDLVDELTKVKSTDESMAVLAKAAHLSEDEQQRLREIAAEQSY